MIIVERAAWGAVAPKSRPSYVAPARRRYFVVHHSGAPSSQSAREIQHWCMYGRGFSDIDYNFLVDQTGKIYEGRGWDVIGAHTVGYNLVGAGVCIIGNDQASNDAKASCRWLYDQYVKRAGHSLAIRGHRQLATTGTSCPGNRVFAWVSAGMKTLAPVKATPIAQPAATAGPGSRTIRRGSRGADVAFFQRWQGLADDGVFGPKTEAKAMAYQRMKRLTPDGVVGPKTWHAMGVR